MNNNQKNCADIQQDKVWDHLKGKIRESDESELSNRKYFEAQMKIVLSGKETKTITNSKTK